MAVSHIDALLALGREDTTTVLIAGLTAMWLVGCGTRPLKWFFATEKHAAWQRSPTLMLVWRVQLLLGFAMFFYAGMEVFSLSDGERWRTLAYASVIELPICVLVLWMFTTVARIRVRSFLLPGTLEVQGRMSEAVGLLGSEGSPERSISFTLDSDDGMRWQVESDPRAHWARPSLAAGWPTRRVSPTHPISLAWAGLRVGDRVWLIGATEVGGSTRRLSVRPGAGVLIRGGPAAVYTDVLVLTTAFWFFMLSVQSRAWHAALELIYAGY